MRYGINPYPLHAPRFEIVSVTDQVVLLRDLGPWDQYQTITNGAEAVVESVFPMLNGRRLEYLDSEGERAQLRVTDDGHFDGFAPVPNTPQL